MNRASLFSLSSCDWDTHSKARDDTCQSSQVISFMHDLCPLHAEIAESGKSPQGQQSFLFLASLDALIDIEQTKQTTGCGKITCQLVKDVVKTHNSNVPTATRNFEDFDMGALLSLIIIQLKFTKIKTNKTNFFISFTLFALSVRNSRSHNLCLFISTSVPALKSSFNLSLNLLLFHIYLSSNFIRPGPNKTKYFRVWLS